MKLTNTNKKINQKSDDSLLIQNDNKHNHPEISFKYLYKCDVCCFKGLNKIARKDRDPSIFDDLQKFLNEIDNCNSLEEMITDYTSPKGSKIDDSNRYIKRIIKKFEKAYPNEKGLLESGIIHIHTKKNGKGSFVIFGVNYENIFYILAFDPKHQFDKG
ncbi:hypothetical protein [Candidatus Stoquefichus sp. SB1]|uniref:hypothetical protein n=1 Tax=Candidatus Stoquefichus sp. SB1 TaxID=1658109 RepID=UPI00067F6793|nr:hypothetical protein [Candidatus Stoquefichus sp. SB1]